MHILLHLRCTFTFQAMSVSFCRGSGSIFHQVTEVSQPVITLTLKTSLQMSQVLTTKCNLEIICLYITKEIDQGILSEALLQKCKKVNFPKKNSIFFSFCCLSVWESSFMHLMSFFKKISL